MPKPTTPRTPLNKLLNACVPLQPFRVPEGLTSADFARCTEDGKPDWSDIEGHPGMSGGGVAGPVEKSIPCDSWDDLLDAWKEAMEWREGVFDDVLSTMLAVVLSTRRMGDPVLLMVVGDPGSGKSRFCDALLHAPSYCTALDTVTGLVSGWKTGHGSRGKRAKQHSFLERANGKTWVTSEADVLIKSPDYAKVMSQTRRIFDGRLSASYKTMDEDMNFENLRISWVKAGTPAMLTRDVSGLGDRFLKLFIPSPKFSESRRIARSVMASAWGDVGTETGGNSGDTDSFKILNPAYEKAYGMTGGYLDHLTENIDERLSEITASDELFNAIEWHAHRVAYFRARPDLDEEVAAVVEQPNRVAAQLVRVARCLSAVRGETNAGAVVDAVARLGRDSCRGYTLEIAEEVASSEENGGLGLKAIQLRVKRPPELVKSGVAWLVNLGIIHNPSVSARASSSSSAGKFRLTKLGKWLMGEGLNHGSN